MLEVDEIDDRIVLAAERHGAVGAAPEADDGLAAEFAPALAERAGADVEAVLELEQRGQAAAEILDAAQPPAAARQVAAAELHEARRVAAVRVLRVVDVCDARVGDAVQRDAALCVRAGGDERGRQGEQRE